MSIRSDFAEIVEWCAEYAPATAAALYERPSEEQLAEALRATGTEWPSALTELYRQANGSGGQRAFLFAGYYFISVEELVDRWENMAGRWESDERAADSIRRAVADDGTPDSAGYTTAYWSRLYYPFAEDGDGGYLFVDDRQGPNNGCVRCWDRLERDSPAIWESLASMLRDTAETVIRGADLLDQVPAVENGSLVWSF